MLKQWTWMISAAALWAVGASSAFAASAGAEASWQDWSQARSLYDAGKFEDALHELVSHPSDSASYYYNIGTIYSRMDRLGPAVAYLEKANHVQPHDPDIQHNLEIEKSALGKLIGPDRLDPASTPLEALADHASLEEVRGTLGLLGLVLALLWIRAYLKTRSLRQTLLRPAGMFGVFGFALTAGVYFAQRVADAHPPAFCVERQIVRSGPGDSFLELGSLEGGTKIRVLGPTAVESNQPAAVVPGQQAQAPQQTAAPPANQELWRQVRYSQDGIGWVRSSSLLLL